MLLLLLLLLLLFAVFTTFRAGGIAPKKVNEKIKRNYHRYHYVKLSLRTITKHAKNIISAKKVNKGGT
jgi:hypothetical protein